MKISASKINTLLLFKLPAAYITGVRTTYLDSDKCSASVKFRWINQNPFKSMFWAVQGMAAELTTGALVISKIKESGHPISMLLAKNSGTFLKKVTGRVTFNCDQGQLVSEAIEKSIETGEGQIIEMTSIGLDSDGIEVSNFTFEWTIKVRN